MILLLLGALIFFDYVHGVNIQEIRALPKAELHLHLGGSFPLEYLKTIATEEQYKALQNGIDQFVTGVDYTKAFFVFGLINAIVNTPQRIADGTYHLCKALQEDGVTYAEIRTRLKDLGSGCEGYLKSVLRGIERASCDTFKARVLLSVKRASSKAFVQETIDLALRYKNNGVVGIDISDNAVQGDINNILPIFLEGKKQGLPFVIHMGESPLETDQILLLDTLDPVRIGHGVHLCTEALERIKTRRIPVEVCLSSSVCAKMIAHQSEHPGLRLYKEGYPVVVCTDDPLIFKTTLSQEYVSFVQEAHCSSAQLKNLIADSHRFCCERVCIVS